MPRVLGVIPARYASSRFPGKPLAPLGDRSLIEAVWRRATAAASLERLVVATDDRRILQAVQGFGAEVVLTAATHPSGTDRVAEVVRSQETAYDVVINIQGDEPLLSPGSLDRLVEVFDGPDVEMATLAEPIVSLDELLDPNVVKLVTAANGRALYFSRSPIPYYRGDGSNASDLRRALTSRPGGLGGYRKHQGIYAYRPAALARLTALEPSPLERDEDLEQLRALEAGIAIRVVDSDYRSLAVDTPADLERVAKFLAEAH